MKCSVVNCTTHSATIATVTSDNKKIKSTASYFNIFITGQIESAAFPLGPDASEIFCRYEVVCGRDWELVSGLKSGITQSASNRGGHFNDEIIFNMPIELTYKSTSPFGWPQLILCIYGKTRWGIETALGYCRVHVPIFSTEKQTITTPILMPKCNSMISELAGWITGKNPELKNPKILMDSVKSKGLSIESYGEVKLSFNIVARGIDKLGYDWS